MKTVKNENWLPIRYTLPYAHRISLQRRALHAAARRSPGSQFVSGLRAGLPSMLATVSPTSAGWRRHRRLLAFCQGNLLPFGRGTSVDRSYLTPLVMQRGMRILVLYLVGVRRMIVSQHPFPMCCSLMESQDSTRALGHMGRLCFGPLFNLLR